MADWETEKKFYEEMMYLSFQEKQIRDGHFLCVERDIYLPGVISWHCVRCSFRWYMGIVSYESIYDKNWIEAKMAEEHQSEREAYRAAAAARS